MAHRFTSIGYTLERLQECEHFLGQMVGASGRVFDFELNAFLSACRSVTFVLQKSFGHVPHFEPWFSAERDRMRNDAAMRFFLELRNISQKQGPVSYVAASSLSGQCIRRFVSGQATVPPEIRGRDITECCAEHLQKLAALVLNFFRQFPFDACMARALTPKGMRALQYTFRDVETLLGLPAGYTDVGGAQFTVAVKLRILRREVEPTDETNIERLARGQFLANGNPVTFPKSCRELADDIAHVIEQEPELLQNPRAVVLKAIFQRIDNREKDRRAED